MAIAQYLKRFMDPSEILPYSGIKKDSVIAVFGAGNGYYPVAAAKLVGANGKVYAVDVKSDPLEATVSAARNAGLKNILPIRHDMEKLGTPIEDASCDGVVLSGILHLSQLRDNVLHESYRVLKTGGRVVVVEWKKETLPFGPSFESRLDASELATIMTANGFRLQSEIPADAFHYAMVYIK
jgi:ubiquinone/menaquinone biosynthesis C-methylase UbiE